MVGVLLLPLLLLLDLLLLPPQAASIMAVTRAMATRPAPLRLRDPRTCLTYSPQELWAGNRDRQSA